MDKIFLGLIFIFFDINIFFIIFNINLLPNFIGYILIYLGLKELGKYSDKFKKSLLISRISIIISMIKDIGIFLMIINMNNVLVQICNIILTLSSIYIFYKMAIGIKDLEHKEERNYGGKLLLNILKIWSIVAIASYSNYFIPEQYRIVLLIVYTLVSLAFLIMFYRTKEKYNSYH